uniref:BZIP domain-containing protein n=1 Tax=Setaria digitata TaxID=48799 RepID=A0A915Q695_9BILA
MFTGREVNGEERRELNRRAVRESRRKQEKGNERMSRAAVLHCESSRSGGSSLTAPSEAHRTQLQQRAPSALGAISSGQRPFRIDQHTQCVHLRSALADLIRSGHDISAELTSNNTPYTQT